MTNTKMYLAAGLALMAYVAAGVGGYHYGKNTGLTEGLDNFHEACLIGGIIINEKNNTAITCEPLTLPHRT